MKFILLLLIFPLILTAFVQKTHCLSKGEELVNSILSKTAKIIKDKYYLRPCGEGASMPGGPIQELTLCFDTNYPYTKEKLRELLIKTSKELLDQVTKNREIQPFLKEQPFTIKNIEIVIYNHAQNGIGLCDPQISVAEISQKNLIYRAIDPLDSFKYKNEYRETYEEALALIKDAL